MKVLVYKVNKSKKNQEKDIKLNFEKILFFSFIIMFTLLIITQTILMSPSIKTFIPLNKTNEGTTLGAEEYLYKKGEINLELQNAGSDEKLKVLVNGEVMGTFINKSLKLNVKDGDVIELDGSEIISEDEVKIISTSSNINSEILNKKLKIGSGVERLTDIQIK
jgi:hypothetical protein